MTLTRRDALRLLGLSAVVLGPLGATACSTSGPGAPALLPSTAPIPEPYTATLRIPPVLRPLPGGDGDVEVYDLPARSARASILPGLSTTIWGYDGQFPGPTLRVRRGRKVVVRQRNELPVPIVTHLHGGRTPPPDDGYPTDLTMPEGGRFPMHAHDRMAKVTLGSREYEYPFEQRAATLWYHDHRMDFTGPQVWRGLAGFCLVGDEEDDALPLPKGDKDIPLMICDRSFGADGEFRYPALDGALRAAPGVEPAYGGGVLGDVILVNGSPWPVLAVANTRYRFRLLNASNARRYELAMDPEPVGHPEFVQVGTDGGLLAAPRPRRTVTLAPGERADVVVDFTGCPVGSTVDVVNLAGEGSAARVMRCAVDRREQDTSSIPAQLSTMENLDRAEAVLTREFRFESGDIGGHAGWTVNGKPFDPSRMDAQPALDSVEIWRVRTDVEHPIHLHLVHFQVLSIDGAATDIDGWKDTLDLGAARTAEIIMRFSGYRGRYVFHCHNLEHEDMAMMGNFEVR